MTSLVERGQIITMVQEAMNSGARQDRACTVISLNERTLQRWQIYQLRGDQRPCRTQSPTNKLSAQERKHVLTVANSDEFGSLPDDPWPQIPTYLGDVINDADLARNLLHRADSFFHRHAVLSGLPRPA